MIVMEEQKTSVLGIECVEPLIAQLGNSTTLKVPVVVRKDQPNWKKQNPKAYLLVNPSSVQLVYEWKAIDGIITNNEE